MTSSAAPQRIATAFALLSMLVLTGCTDGLLTEPTPTGPVAAESAIEVKPGCSVVVGAPAIGTVKGGC